MRNIARCDAKYGRHLESYFARSYSRDLEKIQRKPSLKFAGFPNQSPLLSYYVLTFLEAEFLSHYYFFSNPSKRFAAR